MANLADYDTRGDAPFRVQQRVHLHPTLTEQLWLCADAPTQQRAKCSMFLAIPKRKGGWSSHPQLCIPFISFYACDLPPIFSFSHTTVSRIVLLSGLGV